MKRTPPSSLIILQAGFQLCWVSVLIGVDSEGSGLTSLVTGVKDEGDWPWWSTGPEPPAYCLSSSSHRARRSWRSWFGRRRLRAGAGVLGVQETFA